ncbi:hypothetical protein DWV30_22375 [Bacteroides ovatus]|uniref:Uncharacterized protein n=1 Tax=Bacteroides ovatus TaxID=28116 RepID=A0A413EKB6_BACOV|nr:hypothetical protein DWZ47_09265 [Bacteroides sp. AF32-8BH]RGX07403.1 hypothetical protein DWV35_19000 [Bacteroides ovatus]RGX17924.1 hypothetical protein DWV30_22375 [Bacteroides ovatus]
MFCGYAFVHHRGRGGHRGESCSCRWQMLLCFFNFIVGGLRIKIRVTTVSHKPNSPLCPPRPLW